MASIVHFQGSLWCYYTNSFVSCYYWTLNLCFSGCLLKIKRFSIKGSETTGMIQPTQDAIYFFSAPSVPLNCTSQSNQASVFNYNLTSARERDKSSFTPICILGNPYSTAACFHKRAEDEVCGVLTPTVLYMTAQHLLAIKWHQPCIIPLYHHSILHLQRYDDIQRVGSLLWLMCCILQPPAQCSQHCSVLFDSLQPRRRSRLSRIEVPGSEIPARVLCSHQFPSPCPTATSTCSKIWASGWILLWNAFLLVLLK